MTDLALKYYRQGDIAIIPIERKCRPAPKTRVQPDCGRIVLAYGEVTGHAHALPAGDVELYETANAVDRILRVRSHVTTLTHEEHAPIELPQGDYIVRRQREYEPEAIRLVAD